MNSLSMNIWKHIFDFINIKKRERSKFKKNCKNDFIHIMLNKNIIIPGIFEIPLSEIEPRLLQSNIILPYEK